MISVGVDIEEISRFAFKTLEKDSAFLNRIFTKNELDYCIKKANPAPHLTARFCAKEAVVKAMSNLYNKLIPYSKIVNRYIIIKKRKLIWNNYLETF